MTNTDHPSHKTEGSEICPFHTKLWSHFIPQVCKYSLLEPYTDKELLHYINH
jgi:hypothetical protein